MLIIRISKEYRQHIIGIVSFLIRAVSMKIYRTWPYCEVKSIRYRVQKSTFLTIIWMAQYGIGKAVIITTTDLKTTSRIRTISPFKQFVFV
jgi:phosphatidylserine synthase